PARPAARTLHGPDPGPHQPAPHAARQPALPHLRAEAEGPLGREGARGGDARRLRPAAQQDLVLELPARRLVVARAAQDRLAGQHAAGHALRAVAEARGLVDRVTDHRVLEALLGA